MSRNKDIEFMHAATGWSYKVCRQKMKDNHWNLWKAIGYDDALKYISDTIPKICEVFADAIQNVADAAAKLANDMAEIIKSMVIDVPELSEVHHET